MGNILITTLILLLFLTSVLLMGLEFTTRCHILKRFPVLDTLIISLGFGLGFFALIVFSLGILHLLYLYVIIALVLPFIVLNFSKKINFLKSINIKNYFVIFKSQNAFYKILILFLVLNVLLNLLRAFAPVTDWDSVQAYLYIPKLFAESHSITRISFSTQDDLPLNIQMITTLSLLIKDEIFAQLITGWTFGVLASLAIYIIGKQLVNREVGIIAAILFSTIPEVLWLTCSTKIDLGWVFWEYLALYLFLDGFKNKEKPGDYKILYLSFVFLGFSLGAKYVTFLSIIFYSVITLFVLLKANKVSFKAAITIIVIANLITCSLASPYYIKNMIFTNNPIPPFNFMTVVWSSTVSVFTVFVPTFSVSAASSDSAGNNYTAILGIINYYWNLFFRLDFIAKPMALISGAKSFGAYIIAFLPLFIMDKKNRLIFSLFIILWFFITFIMMFIYLPEPRHLLNSIPLLIIPASAGLYYLFKQKNLIRFCFFGTLIFMIFIGLNERGRSFFKNESKVVFGRETKEVYLERRLFSKPYHCNVEMMNFIKNKLDKNSKILTLYYGHAFYVDRIMVASYYLERPFIFYEINIDKFLENLNNLGITHVYLSDIDYNYREPHFQKAFANTIMLNSDFKKTYLQDVFSSGDQHLFRIKYKTINTIPAINGWQ